MGIAKRTGLCGGAGELVEGDEERGKGKAGCFLLKIWPGY